MPSTIARTTRRSRMLAVVALAGAAALVAGCTSGGTDPGATTTPGVTPGAEPVPLDDTRLPGLDIFDGSEESAIAVRWATPGESLAIIVGGSGAGGECIPQPQGAGLDPSGPTVTVRFDPPNPEAMCTMDFRLHGWELVLPEPIDPSAVVPVELVNTSGAEETIEVELGPDDLLDAGATADPQPSEIPDAGETPAPEPIPAAQLPDAATVMGAAEEVQVHWIDRGSSLAVVLTGSGTAACVPQPVDAVSTGPGTIEVAFEPAAGTTCTDDLVFYGWRITLPEAVSATLPVQVRVTGASDAGPFVDLTLEPDEVLELP